MRQGIKCVGEVTEHHTGVDVVLHIPQDLILDRQYSCSCAPLGSTPMLFLREELSLLHVGLNSSNYHFYLHF